MLQPTVRRTWSLKGKTPIHKSWGRHDRLSVISALTVSPIRRNLGLYFDVYSENIRTWEVVAFLYFVYRRLGRKLIVVMDRWSVHKAAAKKLSERFGDIFDIEWLPAYAPELNPTEQVWRSSKYGELANFIPDDINHLYSELKGVLTEKQSRKDLLQSFFKWAKLEL